MTTTTTTLLTGDARAVLATLAAASVDLCVTSPPYGRLIHYGTGRRGDVGASGGIDPAGYADWLVPIVGEIARVLRPGGVFALNLNGQEAFTYPEEVAVRIPRETPLVLHERMCWVKANAIPSGFRGTHLIPEWEPIWVWRHGPSLAYFGRDDIRRPYSPTTLRRAAAGNLHRGRQGNHRHQAHPYVRHDKAEYIHSLGRDAANVIWAAPEQSPQWPHPARFPEALPAFFVGAYCPPGGTVLDPFVGSGTTCAVAQKMGRHSIGIEIEAHHIATARDRTRQPGWVLEDAP